DDVGILFAHGALGIGRRGFDLDALLAQRLDQARRVLRADDRQRQRLFGLLEFARDQRVDQQHEDQRREQRPGDQGVDHGAAVAQVFAHFLEEHDQRGFHAASPSSVPISLTNASSRLASPVCARSTSGASSATTLPLAITTMRSHSAATSCMMWLENNTQRPSRLRRLRNSRIARVAMTSRPLVGSSRITFFGSWIRARAIAVFTRWPCE